MLVPCKISPLIKFAGTHLYVWAEKDTVKVKYLVPKHNIISPDRARTHPLNLPGAERTNLKVTPPSTLLWRNVHLTFIFKL